MKFSTCMAALIATTLSPNSVVVSARPLLQKDEDSSSKNKSTMAAATVSSSPQLHVPSSSSSSSSSAPFLPSPEGGHLTLFGLDPNEPLTLDEATFLEETIRDVFNKIHKENDVDLVARSVSIMQDNIGGNGNGNGNGNDSVNRSLLRGSMENSRRDLWVSDRDMCHYDHDGDGYKKRDIIPGCTFEIEWYQDCYCHLCDDDSPPNWWPSTSPSSAPVPFYLRFQDDDDDDDNYVPWSRPPTPAPTPAPTRAPTPAPTPAPPPSIYDHLEYVRTPSPNSTPRPRPIDMENEILKKLKKSRFSYFKKITGLVIGNLRRPRFGGGN